MLHCCGCFKVNMDTEDSSFFTAEPVATPFDPPPTPCTERMRTVLQPFAPLCYAEVILPPLNPGMESCMPFFTPEEAADAAAAVEAAREAAKA